MMTVQPSLARHASIYVPEPATLIRAEPLTAWEQFLEVRLDSTKELGHMPGQFVSISVPGIGEAPISVSSSPDLSGSFELVVRKVGRVTAAVHGLEPGDKVGVRGPFGTSFPVTEDLRGRDILFVCGGIGLVPVRSAIQYVLNHREDYGRVIILYGSKSPAERLFVPELEAWDARDDVTFMETVDRGDANWTGNTGVITTLIPKITVDPGSVRVVMCGPPVMYRFTIMGLHALGVHEDHIYVSLERRMKCGVGKCGHCQINGLYTCLDGPVFKYATVKDAPEAI
jgi:sulfhydrogenase subunit gamma (sulfur reductase)